MSEQFEDKINSIEERTWGELPMVQSHTNYNLQYTELSKINDLANDSKLIIRARVQNIRAKGNMAFLVLREGYETAQAVAFKSESIPKPALTFIGKISNESIVDIHGTVKVLEKPLQGVSLANREISIEKFYLISRSASVLPFQMADAMRDESKTDSQEVTVALKIRLDNRFFDLRVPATQAVFRIQAGVCKLFREYMESEEFLEIHSPKIIPGSSEGGSEVFTFDYFGTQASLAQSPQLYKQMAIMGDIKKVYEIGHVFRAEKSFTHRHLCEFIGLDAEMQIHESYFEVTKVIADLFKHMFKGLKQKYQREIQIIKDVYGFEEFQFLEEPLLLTFQQGCDLLKENGIYQDPTQDISTDIEKKLGQIVKEKYNTDFYILHQYPVAARPFYTMLNKEDPTLTNSYDVFMRGQEIISGAQRIHDPEILKERAIVKGIQVETIQSYIDSFKYGAYPHGGFGVGLERVVMLYLGIYDSKKCSLFPRDPTRLAP